MRYRVAFAMCTLLAFAAGAHGQAKSTLKHDGRALYESLADVINTGAELFNAQRDPAGCFRVYQGGLLSIRPVLPKNLQEEIDASLQAAGKLTSASDRAFALRKTIDRVRTWASSQRPLWDRLGGDEKVAKIVADFVRAAGPDPRVNFSRNGTYKVDASAVEINLLAFVSSISGGPFGYSGKNMKDAHRGMKITDAEYDALVFHLVDALEKSKVADNEANEVLTAVEAMRRDIVEAGATVATPKKSESKKGAPAKAEVKSPVP